MLEMELNETPMQARAQMINFCQLQATHEIDQSALG